MAQNAFRKKKGKWLMKDFTLVASAGAVEMGDMMKFTDTTPATVALGTNAADCLVGISAGDYSSSTATQAVKIWVPAEPKAECLGRVTAGKIEVGDTDAGRTCELNNHEGAEAGKIEVGDTDAGRTCELNNHEGADVDTTGDNNLYIVKGIKAATTDGAGTATTATSSNPGYAVFRICQPPEARKYF